MKRDGKHAAMRFVAAITMLLLAGTAQAKPEHCMARIITDVAAEEASEQMLSKSNGDFGPVTRIKVNKKSGKMTYCGHDTYCYSSNAFELVTPCRIKRDTEMTDDSFFVYFTR